MVLPSLQWTWMPTLPLMLLKVSLTPLVEGTTIWLLLVMLLLLLELFLAHMLLYLWMLLVLSLLRTPFGYLFEK